MGGIEKLSVFLKQPYPFYYRGGNFFLFNGLIFILALTFNYFFKPFDVYVPEHKMAYFWISLIHSFTPVLISILFLPFFRNPKIDEKWNVGKEILLIAVFLFLIGVAQFLIRDIIYDNPNNWSWRYFFEEIRNTFMVGILMVGLLISLNFNRLNRLNIKKAEALSVTNKAEIHSPNSSSVFITAHIKGDHFNLDVADFLFARAEGNYVELFVRNGSAIDKLLKRISIKDLESQLNTIPHIVKTHRSYLVNLHFVEKVTGNAQGYRLKLKESEESITVSRNMIPLFEERLKVI